MVELVLLQKTKNTKKHNFDLEISKYLKTDLEFFPADPSSRNKNEEKNKNKILFRTKKFSKNSKFFLFSLANGQNYLW